MTANIDKMFFANLNGSDIDFIERSSRTEDSRKQLQENLIQYLKLWEGKDWVDDEKLWLLGMRLANVWPQEHKQGLENSVQASVGKPVSDYFISGFLRQSA